MLTSTEAEMAADENIRCVWTSEEKHKYDIYMNTNIYYIIHPACKIIDVREIR